MDFYDPEFKEEWPQIGEFDSEMNALDTMHPAGNQQSRTAARGVRLREDVTGRLRNRIN